MYSEIQLTSLYSQLGINIDEIRSCCISGHSVYLSLNYLGLVTGKATLSTLQFLSILPLPNIRGIIDFGSGRLCLFLRRHVYVYYERRRRLHFLFKKGDYDEIKIFRNFFFVGRRNERRVDIYSRERLVFSFETQGITYLMTKLTPESPFGLFINSQHIFVLGDDNRTRIYSSSGSLIKTLEVHASFLDEHYLYCKDEYEGQLRVSLVSLLTLEIGHYVIIEEDEEEFGSVYGVVMLGSKMLVKTLHFLHLFEFRGNGNEPMRLGNERVELVWKSRQELYWSPNESLFVLDIHDSIYTLLDVLIERVRIILISDWSLGTQSL